MTGFDPLGPDGLNDLQREGVRLKEESSRKPRSPLDDDYEPQTLNEAHWWVQPRWAKIVSLVVGLPAFAGLYYQTNVADDLNPWLIEICVGLFVGVALLQLAFVIRGYWRMDI